MAKKHVQFLLSDEDQAFLEAKAAEVGMPPNMFARSILVAFLHDDVRAAAFNAVFWRVYGHLKGALTQRVYPTLRTLLLQELGTALEVSQDLAPELTPIEGAEAEALDTEDTEPDMTRLEGKRRRRGKRGGRGR